MLLFGNGKLLFETLWSNIKDSGYQHLKQILPAAVISDTYVFNIAQSANSNYVVKNAAINGMTKTKVTDDAKGLVTAKLMQPRRTLQQVKTRII